MLYYIYFSSAGTAAESLTPTWSSLITAENGTDKTATANSVSPITEIGGTGNGGGWYKFRIKYGAGAWDVGTEDLVGVIDGGAGLTDNVDRYKPVVISLRGLALARIGHKGVQAKSTGYVSIYETDGTSESNKELILQMTDDGTNITRNPTVA